MKKPKFSRKAIFRIVRKKCKFPASDWCGLEDEDPHFCSEPYCYMVDRIESFFERWNRRLKSEEELKIILAAVEKIEIFRDAVEKMEV